MSVSCISGEIGRCPDLGRFGDAPAASTHEVEPPFLRPSGTQTPNNIVYCRATTGLQSSIRSAPWTVEAEGKITNNIVHAPYSPRLGTSAFRRSPQEAAEAPLKP